LTPDGTRIAFASDRMSEVPGELVTEMNSATIKTSAAMTLHLFTSRPDGSDLRQLTRGPHQDHRPTWSPDGRWIAFASNRTGETAIWRVPSDGSTEPEPVFTDHWGFRPWFTNDGTAVLFYGPDSDRHRIWRLDVRTGATSPVLSDDRGMTHGPFVRPGSEGRLIAHSTRSGTWQIWEFPLIGREEPRLLTPPGFSQAAHATQSRGGTLVFDVKADWGVPARARCEAVMV
jgi:Tol biopolymer transport system component